LKLAMSPMPGKTCGIVNQWVKGKREANLGGYKHFRKGKGGGKLKKFLIRKKGMPKLRG